ncbi:MAG: hypothetical protein ACI9SY_000257 [Candidatus Paceibacteria bacterium]|jgi:hypothetical protein
MEQQTTQVPQPVHQIPQAGSDTHSYRGWLNSDHFYKRALAIFGYGIVGYFIMILPLTIFIVAATVLAT